MWKKICCFAYGKRSDVQRQQQDVNSRRTAEESRTIALCAVRDMCSSPSRVKTTTMKFVFVASLLSMQHNLSSKSKDWLPRNQNNVSETPNGATCIPVDCCFSGLA